jgi:ABC-2 type transport system permease protein
MTARDAARGARLVLHQLEYEQRTFWRTPQAVFFTFALPVLMLVVFATLNSGYKVSVFQGRRFVEYFVAGMLAFGSISATYGNLAARLVFRRESGQLKRFRATPLPASTYLAGIIASSVTVSVAVSAVVLAVGRVFYDVSLPASLLRLVAVLIVGSGAFCALGLALTTFIPNTDAADATVFGTLLPVLFISGVFQVVPTGSLMDRIAALFPVRHLVRATLDVYAGEPFPWLRLLAVVAWGAFGALIAIRRFRWSPR